MSNDIHVILNNRLKQISDAVDTVERNHKRYIIYENHARPLHLRIVYYSTGMFHRHRKTFACDLSKQQSVDECVREIEKLGRRKKANIIRKLLTARWKAIK